MEQALKSYSGEGVNFASNMSPELILAAIIVPILLGIYFVSRI